MKTQINYLIIFTFAFCLFTFAFTSCVSWEPGWKLYSETKSQKNSEILLNKAAELEKSADSKEKVQDLINTYKEVTEADPSNIFAMWKIGNYNILMGAAYAEKKKERKMHYMEAVEYCEKAMYLNPEFKKKVDSGIEVWDACDVLGENEINAMGYWYTAIFYYFKECLSVMGRVFNTKLVIHNEIVMNRIDEIDPNWAGGGNYFSRGIYYVAVPKKFGGSKEKAAECFAKAIEVGPEYMVNHWGRAKYLYAITGNKKGYIDDLNWVLGQNPPDKGNPYPWNVYFQRQADMMLKNIDKTFK
ncbi:TRAP transporter TatT component family protein [Bacteroidota bacterium]